LVVNVGCASCLLVASLDAQNSNFHGAHASARALKNPYPEQDPAVGRPHITFDAHAAMGRMEAMFADRFRLELPLADSLYR
jgi:hypothetical protein